MTAIDIAQKRIGNKHKFLKELSERCEITSYERGLLEGYRMALVMVNAAEVVAENNEQIIW